MGVRVHYISQSKDIVVRVDEGQLQNANPTNDSEHKEQQQQARDQNANTQEEGFMEVETHANPTRTFTQVISRELLRAITIREWATPRIMGGNIAITIEEDEYNKGLAEFVNYLIGHLVLSRGNK